MPAADVQPSLRLRGEPRLLDRLRAAIRARHYSLRTEDAYVAWARRYIVFHGKRHPSQLGPEHISAFLTALAVERHVSASTQNQALAALLFLYRDVLGSEPGWLDGIVRARRPKRLPVVLSPAEVGRVLALLAGCVGSSPPSCTAPGCVSSRRGRPFPRGVPGSAGHVHA